MVHAVALAAPHEYAFRERWFMSTGQPLPASIGFFVSGSIPHLLLSRFLIVHVRAPPLQALHTLPWIPAPYVSRVCERCWRCTAAWTGQVHHDVHVAAQNFPAAINL